MSTLDARKNFAISTVTLGYDASATSIVLTTGDGAKFPQPSTDGAFNLVWWNSAVYPSPADDPNKEIVRCTARTSDTLTVIRAQEGTSATTKNTAGGTYKVQNGPTKKTIDDIETVLDSTEKTANKGAANGYAPLGSDSLVPSAYLPDITITDTFVVGSQAAMLALTCQKGDVAVRTDLNKTFILKGTDPTVLANWQELLTPTDTVLSVNGQTGAVTLTTSNIAEGSNLYFTAARALAAFTISTGLTLATATLTANLSTGVVGGQSVVGGTASGNNLTLSSTSHATKGNIVFGTSVYDEVNNRLGIGTTSPGRKLDVYGGSSPAAFRTSDYVSSTTGSALLFDFGASSGNTYSQLNAVSAGGSVANNLVLQPTGGNVGIGTTSPGSKFQISAGNSAYLPSTSAFSIRKLEEGYGLFAGVDGSGTSWMQSGTSNDATKYSLVLNPNGGNVGIGTTSPAGKLDVSAGLGSQTAGDLVVDTANNIVYIGKQDSSSGNTNFIFRDRLGSVKSRWENAGSGSIGFGNFSNGYGVRIGPTISGSIGSIGTMLLVQNANAGSANPTSIFKQGSTQTGDLTQWQDIAGTVIAKVDASGRIGLGNGTTANTSNIDIQSAGTGVRTLMSARLSNANVNQLGGFWNFYTNVISGADFFGQFGYKFEGGVSDAFKQFQIYVADSVTPKVVIDGSGRMGIGTITPDVKLKVFGTGEVVRIGNDTAADAYISFANRGAFGLDAATGLRFQGTNSRPIVFAINSTWGLGEVGRFDLSGNFVVGDTTATAKLNVYSTAGTDASGLRITSANGYTAFYQDGSDDSRIDSVGASNGGFYVNYDTAKIYSINNNQLYIKADGNIGFGTSAPTAVLHLKAGTATASTAPIKLTSGVNLTTAETGAIEYNGTNLFFTRSGAVRENVLVAIDNVAAPTTSIGVGIVNYYGSAATNFLGDPNRWLSVNVLGSTYKIPLYT